MTERKPSGTGKRCVAWCAMLLMMGAMAPAAHAEGGLPGSPGAVAGSAPLVVSTSLPQDSASQLEPTAADSAGSAVFSPFGELSMTRASRQSQVLPDPNGWAADHNFTLVVAAAGVAAIAWLLLKDV